MFDTSQPPTAADLRAWLELNGRDDVADDLLGLAVAVATAEQAKVCDTIAYGPDLFHAALRRAGRVFAGKAAALGRIDLGDFGAPTIARWDALIDSGEAGYRRGGFA